MGYSVPELSVSHNEERFLRVSPAYVILRITEDTLEMQIPRSIPGQADWTGEVRGSGVQDLDDQGNLPVLERTLAGLKRENRQTLIARNR